MNSVFCNQEIVTELFSNESGDFLVPVCLSGWQILGSTGMDGIDYIATGPFFAAGFTLASVLVLTGKTLRILLDFIKR